MIDTPTPTRISSNGKEAPLAVNEPTRVQLKGLYQASQRYTDSRIAEAEFRSALTIVFVMLGLDPAQNNTINFETGIVTPPIG